MAGQGKVQYSSRGCPIVELVYKIELDQYFMMIHTGDGHRLMALPQEWTGEVNDFISPRQKAG